MRKVQKIARDVRVADKTPKTAFLDSYTAQHIFSFALRTTYREHYPGNAFSQKSGRIIIMIILPLF